jgi:hypothetical protein
MPQRVNRSITRRSWLLSSFGLVGAILSFPACWLPLPRDPRTSRLYCLSSSAHAYGHRTDE